MNAWRSELATAPGVGIIRASWAGTALFTVSAGAACIWPEELGSASVVISLGLFFVGCGAFLVAYGAAVARSRTEAIGIGGLFFLHASAPPVVRRALMASLGVEMAVALLTASVRLYTVLAFGILVPMYGLGLAGLWGARHGSFQPRVDPTRT